MIEIWHNPRCSKSRQTLALIEAAGVDFKTRLYLQDAPSVDEIKDALSKLGVTANDITRKGEKVFKELNLKDADDEALLAAMAEHPILIERPIAIKGDTAVMGRPPENVNALF